MQLNRVLSKVEKTVNKMSGFTLIELITAVSGVSILIGLLLPAIQN